MTTIIKLILLIAAIVIIGPLIEFKIGLPKLYSTDRFNSEFSQIYRINPKDEYVIVEQINRETFSREEFRNLFERFPVGDTTATLSLVANYQYHIRLSELSHQLNDRTLTLNVPALYLSRPVAFHSASLTETGNSSLFGKDPAGLLTELRNEASSALESKGNLQKNNVREKAAQTLAENLNNYFSNTGSSHYYDEILVNFEDDNRTSQPKFVFNNGFCGTDNCKLEFEYAEGKTIVIE